MDELRLIVDNGSPVNPNVLPGGTDIPLTELQRDTSVVVSLPVNGTVTAGPFTPTAGAASTDALLVDAPVI